MAWKNRPLGRFFRFLGCFKNDEYVREFIPVTI